jgi:hypothetical protein
MITTLAWCVCIAHALKELYKPFYRWIGDPVDGVDSSPFQPSSRPEEDK